MRVRISEDPFVELDRGKSWIERGTWPCKWICHPDAGQPPFVTAYRKRFSIAKETKIRIHVSADERYDLYLDGTRIGCGPERGDRENWFYESYDLDLKPGDHTIVARTWSLGPMAPYAQMSVQPGFILAPDMDFVELLGTGVTEWQVTKLEGYQFVEPAPAWGTGANLVIDGARFSWNFERGEGEGWLPAQPLHEGANALIRNEVMPVHLLRPATLPPMIEQEVVTGSVRFVSEPPSEETHSIPIRSQDNLESEIGNWNLIIRSKGSITIPPNTIRRVIVDLENYHCAYPEVVASGGKESLIRVLWAESLYENFEGMGVKGNRDEIYGKFFQGVGDTFKPDGGRSRKFETLWWQAGRYIEILVCTAEDPLTIESLRLRETRYPLENEAVFDSSDSRLSEVVPIMIRGLQMCSHETYMDCPYYEQLMYVGDTRLEALTTYAITHDDRLPRKALRIFDVSRKHSGLTQSRYPSRVTQIIPPFSLWWIGMVYDFAFWRDDISLVRSLMPGVRAVIDAYLSFINSDGLVQAPVGWNFMDWVPEWHGGIPPDADQGVNGLINWQFVLALTLAAEVEEILSEKELAARARRIARELAQRATEAFWSEERGAFAEDLSKCHFSEHTQCLAILSGLVDEHTTARIATTLVNDPNLYRTTIYFNHYLFETYYKLGLTEPLFNRLGLWFELRQMGFKTTVETPEPSRSDCHGWGAHAYYHYFASILGVRPSSASFKTVRIEPRLGPLEWAKGRMPHPAGWIAVDFAARDGNVSGTIELPDGVTGELVRGEDKTKLRPGIQQV
ncbi:MAG: alpha-L-rhamnosidase [Armatimonadetes bacterium]|nr:alpha-L-rhamnosidase [Armatimonadota bacterium]